MKDVDFKVFRSAAELADGRVVRCAWPAADAASESTRTRSCRSTRQGLAYIKVNERALAATLQFADHQEPHDRRAAGVIEPPRAGRRPDLASAGPGPIVPTAWALRTRIGTPNSPQSRLFEPAGARCG